MQKCTALSLILLQLIFMALESNGKCSEHIKSERYSQYLDDAMDLLKKGRQIYPSCHNKISVATKTCQSGPALDCTDLYKIGYNVSGIYDIWPKNRILHKKSVEVYCDMHTDGGGWTVIQRRGDFSNPHDYFFQNWSSYRRGFGNLDQDFWLGNDKIYAISNQKMYSIRFDLKNMAGDKVYALYDLFWIENESHKYTLHIKGYSGDAGDSMAIHDGQKFSTKDQDNDRWYNNNCAKSYKGGWWYNECHRSNLNGLNLRGKHESYADGVNWFDLEGPNESLDTTEIKIREHDFHLAEATTLQEI